MLITDRIQKMIVCAPPSSSSNFALGPITGHRISQRRKHRLDPGRAIFTPVGSTAQNPPLLSGQPVPQPLSRLIPTFLFCTEIPILFLLAIDDTRPMV